ncbi:MAG: SMP-30/gluconolactonase/LRE family protein [Candidatus Margulisbacteria bacterium]|jgi:DNA-binding beta-propeller fold protein YncE|nr:SMP-30/gluconolactonase/LRE family protein [Candidatus Margulisiibacteriota bacterium]
MKKCVFFIFCCGLLCAAVQDPYKLSAAPDGSILLADPLRNRIRILRRDDTELSIEHNFNQPQAAALDKDGNLYVLDTGGHRLWKFTGQDGYQPAGSLDGFRYPRDLAFSPDYKWLYVLDSGHNKIVRVQLDTFKKADSFGELHNPYGLAVDIYGNVFVADTGAGGVLKYSPAGGLLLSFGRRGSLPGELLLPQDVAVGRSKKIYVADTGNKAVQIFSESGAYLGALQEYTAQEIRSLDFAGGTLWLSLPDKPRPERLELGYQIKSLRQDNEYFSPNGDGVLDEAVFQLELESPGLAELEIYAADKLIERLDAAKNQAGELPLVWRPKKARPGVYDYLLFVRDPEGAQEPVLHTGRIYLDLQAPDIDDLTVSPDVLAEKTDTAVFAARSREPARLAYKIYTADKQLAQAAQGAEYRFAPVLGWDGRNKFQELKNGKYSAEITLTDRAGNTSAPQRKTIAINIDHPVIDLAAAEPKYIRAKQAEKLTLRLLRAAKTQVYLSGADGRERLLLDRELPRGEQELDIDTQNLPEARYTLRVYAGAGAYRDEAFSGFVLDNTPPVLNQLALTPAELWSGGIAEAVLSFVPDEDAAIQITLQDTAEVLVPEFWQAAGSRYVYVFQGNQADGRALTSGNYVLLLTARDLAGNTGIFRVPFRITADGPQFRPMTLNPAILSRESPLYRSLHVSYELGGSTGPLYLTGKLYHNGELYKIIADRERRPRGRQFDQIYASADMPEGEYSYEYILADDFGHRAAAAGSFFCVRSSPRILSLTQTDPAISPINQDGVKDKTFWNFTAQLPEYLAYYAVEQPDFAPLKVYLSIDGELLQEQVVQSGSMQLSWDGRDARQNYVKDGAHEYEIKIADALGVFSLPVTGSVIVANSREKISRTEVLINGRAADNIFNPESGAGTVTVNIYMKDFPLRQQMILSLYDAAGTLLEKYPAREFTVSQSYSFVIAADLTDGYRLSPGGYFTQLKIIDEVGNDFDYRLAATINYADTAEIISSPQKLSLTAVENKSGSYEVSYVKGARIPLARDAYDFKDKSYDNYFYVDYYQDVALTLDDSTNNRGSGIIDNICGWVKGWSGNLAPGRYRLRASNGGDTTNSTRANVNFWGHDVWFRAFARNTVETQVDSGGLDVDETPASRERARRLTASTQNAFTSDYEHAVTASADGVYYQRRARGQSAGTRPFRLSSTGAAVSAPAICAGEDNSVYVVWIEQTGGNYTVQAVHIPEKYAVFKNDPADSSFALNTMAARDLQPDFLESFSGAPVLAVEKQINYPNPFQDKTILRYRLTRDAEVTIRIFNAAGQPVRQLDFFPGQEGGRGATTGRPYNDVEWDGANDFGQPVLNGSYIYEITAQAAGRAVKARGKMLKWR